MTAYGINYRPGQIARPIFRERTFYLVDNKKPLDLQVFS